MKKLILSLMTCAVICSLTGCKAGVFSEINEDYLSSSSSEQASGVEINYGSSSIYSKDDMDEAIKVIEDEFNTWKGCELHSIKYENDECNSNENIAWLNDLESANDAQKTFVQAIMFKSDFHSPVNGGGAWEADSEYHDWEWWLGRSDGGKWKLMTWGY